MYIYNLVVYLYLIYKTRVYIYVYITVRTKYKRQRIRQCEKRKFYFAHEETCRTWLFYLNVVVGYLVKMYRCYEYRNYYVLTMSTM